MDILRQKRGLEETWWTSNILRAVMRMTDWQHCAVSQGRKEPGLMGDRDWREGWKSSHTDRENGLLRAAAGRHHEACLDRGAQPLGEAATGDESQESIFTIGTFKVTPPQLLSSG